MRLAVRDHNATVEPLTELEYNYFRILILKAAGIDLGESKSSLVMGRLGKRLRALNLTDWHSYIRYLKDDRRGEERQHIINELSTNKTDFMRESKHFEILLDEFLPRYLQEIGELNRPLYFWSAACSKGHEVYTLGMSIEEAQSFGGLQIDYRILGSDINTNVLEFARKGVYDASELEGVVKAHVLKRYFLKGKGKNSGTYRVDPHYKTKIKFRLYNLIGEEGLPIMFDVIFLRNVLIYFNQQTIDKVIRSLYKNLNPGGLLVVGLSENIGEVKSLFDSVGYSMYRKKRR